MKKIPAWLLISAISFFIGIVSVIWFAYLSVLNDVNPPAEGCLSRKFPGKSISVNELNMINRSAFNTRIVEEKSVIPTNESDQLYNAFQEESFEPHQFQDGKTFPEIANTDEIYRFTWLRTFHNPVVIRFYRIDEEKYIVVKQTDGRGGYDKGKLIFNESRKLKDSEWCEFIKLLDEAKFWDKNKIDTLANDGAMWNIEGIREQRYYIAGEQSPQTGKFREACIYLMRISGLKIDENSREFY